MSDSRKEEIEQKREIILNDFGFKLLEPAIKEEIRIRLLRKKYQGHKNKRARHD